MEAAEGSCVSGRAAVGGAAEAPAEAERGGILEPAAVAVALSRLRSNCGVPPVATPALPALVLMRVREDEAVGTPIDAKKEVSLRLARVASFCRRSRLRAAKMSAVSVMLKGVGSSRAIGGMVLAPSTRAGRLPAAARIVVAADIPTFRAPVGGVPNATDGCSGGAAGI